MLTETAISIHGLWLTLGGVLLIAEMLGSSGYLLWCALSALITGLICWLFPLSWAWQGIIFALLTLLTAFLWYHWLTYHQQKRPPVMLNQRGAQLTGLQLTLEKSLVNGYGHVRIGDSSWRVQADCDLVAGTRVIVTAVEGITLRIESCL